MWLLYVTAYLAIGFATTAAAAFYDPPTEREKDDPGMWVFCFFVWPGAWALMACAVAMELGSNLAKLKEKK